MRIVTVIYRFDFQVTVLAEQVSAQTDKINDLEGLLEDKGEKLNSTESMLQDVSVAHLIAASQCRRLMRNKVTLEAPIKEGD